MLLRRVAIAVVYQASPGLAALHKALATLPSARVNWLLLRALAAAAAAGDAFAAVVSFLPTPAAVAALFFRQRQPHLPRQAVLSFATEPSFVICVKERFVLLTPILTSTLYHARYICRTRTLKKKKKKEGQAHARERKRRPFQPPSVHAERWRRPRAWQHSFHTLPAAAPAVHLAAVLPPAAPLPTTRAATVPSLQDVF